jgi:hypothetical protein
MECAVLVIMPIPEESKTLQVGPDGHYLACPQYLHGRHAVHASGAFSGFPGECIYSVDLSMPIGGLHYETPLPVARLSATRRLQPSARLILWCVDHVPLFATLYSRFARRRSGR